MPAQRPQGGSFGGEEQPQGGGYLGPGLTPGSQPNPTGGYVPPPRTLDVSTWIDPPAEWFTEGKGPLAGSLAALSDLPAGFTIEGNINSASIPVDKSIPAGLPDSPNFRFVPLFDDYGNPWLVLVDGYDFAALASFARNGGGPAANIFAEIVARNMARAGLRSYNQYAAVIPDGPTRAAQLGNALVLPTDPSIGAPAGTQWMTIGNIPLTIPANPTIGAPALPMNITGNRILRIAFFSSNQAVRQVWLDTSQSSWTAVWHLLVQFLFEIVAAVLDYFGIHVLDGLAGNFDPNAGNEALADYSKRLQAYFAQEFPELQNGDVSRWEGLLPPLNKPAGSLSATDILLAVAAVAVVFMLINVTQKA